MGKRTRIVLYALSLVTMLAMVTLIIFSHGRQSGAPAKDALSETDISSTEEPVQIPEAEEAEETEAADGQNGIQNDTEQEETDKQAEAGNTEGDGSTTLIFAGDVLFANAFKSNYDAGGIEKVIEPQLLQELQCPVAATPGSVASSSWPPLRKTIWQALDTMPQSMDEIADTLVRQKISINVQMLMQELVFLELEGAAGSVMGRYYRKTFACNDG